MQNSSHRVFPSQLSFSRIKEAMGSVVVVRMGIEKSAVEDFKRYSLGSLIVRFDIEPRSWVYLAWFSL